MNSKLRLLITARCPNKCPLCCNNQFKVEDIPVIDRYDYDEVSITGGEPMLDYTGLTWVISTLNNAARLMGKKPTIFLYTAYLNSVSFGQIIDYVDGICYTPHNKSDVAQLKGINRLLLKGAYIINNKSLRLNLFSDMEKLLEGEDLSMWKVKHMEWVKDCPVPEGEDFRRIANLL